MVATSAPTTLLVLCDGHIDVLDAVSLERISSLSAAKAATTFCMERLVPTKESVDKQPRLCAATKKKLMLYRLEQEHYQLAKEWVLPEPAVVVEWYGSRICVGHKRKYSLIDPSTGEVDSISVALEKPPALVAHCDHTFLLRSETGGVFVDRTGQTLPPQINWQYPPLSFGYMFPYIIAVQNGQIQVHHVATGVHVQSIPLEEQHKIFTLTDSGGKIALASSNRVYVLDPIPFDVQVKELLKENRVEEASELLVRTMGEEKGFKQKLARFRQEAGMVYLLNLRFKEAFRELHRSDMDPRELISFFPTLRPLSSNYTAVNRLDLAQLVEKKLSSESTTIRSYLAEADRLLIEFLEARRYQWMKVDASKRHSTEGEEFWRGIDTALIKLYALLSMPDALKDFLTNECCYDFDDIHQFLTTRSYHHSLALVYQQQGMHRKALHIWQRLGSGELKDGIHDGRKDTIELLSRSSNIEDIFEFAAPVFAADPERALQVFTAGPPRGGDDWTDKVLEYLQPHGPAIRMAYLEHVIHNEGNTDEKYHTKLALLYLNVVLDLLPASPALPIGKGSRPGAEPGLLGKVRGKLLDFLRYSNYYSVQTLLHRVKDSPLYDEAIILYSRDGKHQAALTVLVEQMKDYQQAEDYCATNSHRDGNLFLSLLQVYLSLGGSGVLPPPAIRLLNTHAAELDPVKVLPLLPSSLPLDSLLEYLVKAVESAQQKRREKMVERSLRMRANLLLAHTVALSRSNPICIDRETKCSVCNKRIGDKVFAVYPNGVLTHFKCMQSKHICPITGQDFRTV